jgi:serine/threonine protein kinase
MTSDDRDPVDVLAEEFADRLRRGEHPSVSEYAAAHPEHAEQLRALLPAVAQMELLKRFRQPAAAQSLPDRLGDFRIVRELGRGGMGVVFEAVQESLGRPVALKVLARHAQLDTTRRERFVREAQAAAKLHHTNIVPVFGVGEQDGLPYYVMQLIPGCGLHAVVAQWRRRAGRDGTSSVRTKVAPDTRPSGPSGPEGSDGAPVRAPEFGAWRFVAEVGLQTAYALHYAHRHGVLHRDVKPANLIFDGETVWITDFGLAKLVDSGGLTATGDILGTLQYLPPECLGGTADARSDVYGLGATLYELLTLEPPHASDSPARLIKRVADADPVHPRQINPDVPRDLETIVLKAMAREQSARYATARELAEDLEAFLEDRPIKARRTSSAARGWRWCRRNKAVAALALSTLVALSMAAVAGWAGYARAEDRRAEAERARRSAEQATAEADREKARAQEMARKLEDNLKLSLATFEKVFDAASGTERQGFGVPVALLMDGPGGGPWRGHERRPGGGPPGGGPEADSASDKAAILEAVLDFYDKFAQQNALTPQLQVEAAKASRRLCEAHVWLNRPDKGGKAAAAFQRAVSLLEPLVRHHPEKPEWRLELAMAYAVAPAEAYPKGLEEPLRRAVELSAGNSWLAATAQLRLGLVREAAGDRAGAESAYRDAIGSFGATDPSNRPTPGHLEPAFSRLRLATVLGEQGKWPAARKVLEESVASLLPVGGRGPEREWLGRTYWALSDVCGKMNDHTAAANARLWAERCSGFGFGPKKDGPGGKKDGPGGKKDGPWGGKKDGPPPRKDGPKP